MAELFRATALKHRPQTFRDLVGQEHLSRSMSNAIKGGRIAHAYLFSGPRGVGKTSAARILAKSLNCEKGPSPTPCGECSNCVEIAGSASLDVYEIDGASNNGVDQIRKLRESVNYVPSRSKYKIYIIDEVHMLTEGAFNALLKTLEEPPSYVLFIFATTEPAKVKITIRSRTQHYRFKRIPTRTIADHLAGICAAESVEASTEALFLIARSGDGSMRDAQSLLDQVISYAGGAVREEHAREIIGLINSSIYFDFLTYLLEKDIQALLGMVAEMDDRGLDFNDFINGLSTLLRNLILFIEGSDANSLDMVSEEFKTMTSFYDESSQEGFSEDDVIILVDLLITLGKELHHARNPRRIFELHLFRLLNFRNLIKPEEILQRIEALHTRLNGLYSLQESGGPPRKKTGASMPIEIAPAATNTAPPVQQQAAPQSPAPGPQETPPIQEPQQAVPSPAVAAQPPVEPWQAQEYAPVSKAKIAVQQAGTPDAQALLQKLLQEQENTGNFLLVNALSKVTAASIRGGAFILAFHPGDSFSRQQIERDSGELINSFLSDNCSPPLYLTCEKSSSPAPEAPLPPQAEPDPAAAWALEQNTAAPPEQPTPTTTAPQTVAPQAEPAVPWQQSEQQQPDIENETVQQVKDMFHGDIIEDYKQE